MIGLETEQYFLDRAEELRPEIAYISNKFDVELDKLVEATAVFICNCGPYLAERSRRTTPKKVAAKIKKLRAALEVDEAVEDYLYSLDYRLLDAIRLLQDATIEFKPEFVEAVSGRQMVAVCLLQLCSELRVEISSYDDGFLCQWLELMKERFLSDFMPGKKFDIHELAKLTMREGKKLNSFEEKPTSGG